MTEEDLQWAQGYAKQALSDLKVRELLATDRGVEKCHRLHFLQMAAEKTCKAHLASANGHQSVKKSHAYVEGTLPVIARHFYAVANDDNVITSWELKAIKKLAREIELLSPTCTDGDVRLDNTEYPWEDAQNKIQTPCPL